MDDMRKQLENTVQQRDVGSKASRLNKSKDELRRMVNKKIDTTMIGGIAKIEAFFGYLWGHELDEKDCTDAQNDFYEIWQQCRDEILNNGNAQKRAINHELDLFEVNWTGYKTNFQMDKRSKFKAFE